MNTIDLRTSIEAPPEKVLDAVEHPERLVGIVPALQSLRPLSNSPSERNYEWRFDLDGLPVRIVQHRDRDIDRQALLTRRIDGDLAELDATWSVSPHQDHSALRVRITYRIGLPIDGLIAGTFHRHLTRFVLELLRAIKDQAEARDDAP